MIDNCAKCQFPKQNRSITLQNELGFQAVFQRKGARLVAFLAPDKNGMFQNIAFFSPDEATFAGSIVAPVAGRVANGRVNVGQAVCQMPQNEGAHCLHSGPKSLALSLWQLTQHTGTKAVFEIRLPDGGCGLPGNRHFRVQYELCGERLCIEHSIYTDADTFVNPTSHIYWNLSADFSACIWDHSLFVNADRVWYNNTSHLPVRCIPVNDTPFDFRSLTSLQNTKRQLAHELQLQIGNGLNNAFVLTGGQPGAKLYHPASGRTLTLETDSPGLVLYSGGYLEGAFLPKRGRAHAGAALAFEPQLTPQETPLLLAGQTFRQKISYQFGVER